jgi:hypothetical protein
MVVAVVEILWYCGSGGVSGSSSVAVVVPVVMVVMVVVLAVQRNGGDKGTKEC